jgi:hypothetical protein
MRDCHFINE